MTTESLFKQYPNEAAALAKYLSVIEGARPNQKFEMLYLVAQTPSNSASVIARAVEIAAIYRADRGPLKLGISGMDHPAIDTYDSVRLKLIQQAVPESEIMKVGALHHDVGAGKKYERFNTTVEMEAAVRDCVSQGIRTLAICACPFHQPRAYLAAVSSLKQLHVEAELTILSLPGIAQPWNEFAVHSQGIVQGARHEILEGEILRMLKYWCQGDLVAPQEAVRYLLAHCE